MVNPSMSPPKLQGKNASAGNQAVWVSPQMMIQQ